MTAEARADKYNKMRATAEEEAAAHVARIAALEAAAAAATEATRLGSERLRAETAALRTHVEYAEDRCREAERRRKFHATPSRADA